MKNRDKYIIKVNEFDLCCRLQVSFSGGMCWCVIEALTAKEYPCPDDKQCTLTTCEECIQKWLNQEE